LIERYTERVIVKPTAIEIHLIGEPDQRNESAAVVTIPWAVTATASIKGVLHSPTPGSTTVAVDQHGLLTAIAKARAWIDDLVEGRVNSFGEIAKREGKVERHIRLPAPLAFVSPRVIADIVDGAVAPIAVTRLAKRIDYCWAK
jgi:site-specific DNA recombinase